MFLLAIFLIAILSYQNTLTLQKNHISHFAPAAPERKLVTLRGVIADEPEEKITRYKNKRLSFVLKTNGIKVNRAWINTVGLVKVNIYEPKKSFEYGDEVILEGQIYPPQLPANPGQFNYKKYLEREGIYTLFSVNKNNQITLLAKNKANFLINFVFKVKKNLNNLVEKYLLAPENSVLGALLLGSRQEIPNYLEDKFIQTGTVHILSVSGLHVALLSFILIVVFKAVNLPRKMYLILTIILLIFYCLLTGARPPIVRSTIMIEIVLFGLLILREPDIFNSLALAALIILLKNPQELFDIGFQLSFTAVFSIVYFSPKIEVFLNPPSLVKKIKSEKATFLSRLKDFLVKSVSVSLAAWLGTLILIIYYFNIFSPVTILANLFIVPIVTLIMASGFTFLIFSILSPTLALIFSSAVDLFLKILLIGVNFFSNLPFAYLRVSSISLFEVGLYFSILFLAANYKKLHLSAGKLCIILLLGLNLLIWPQIFKSNAGKLKITFLDVGHGDSIFIEFPNDGNMLIDGGIGGDNDKGRWVISPFLWQKGISKIDAIVLTHPHADHVGGLTTVINNFKLKYAFDNGQSLDSWAYKNYILALRNKNISRQILSAPEEIIGYPEVKISVLNPPAELLKGTTADENNNSIVVKIIFKQISFLFCADLEEEGAKQILTLNQDLNSTFIKIPHHGSEEKEIEKIFLEKTKAKAAFITVGQNEFYLPAQSTVKTLNKIGAKIYLTRNRGAITVSSDGYNYSIDTMY